jgi:hypothetical protein
MRNSKEILEKVAELVGLKFKAIRRGKFAQVELEGGYIVSNQSEADFVVGDTIYLVNEDGTYSVVGAGEWTYLDGEKTLTTDEEGKLVEISSGSDDVETEEMEEVEIEVPASIEDVVDEDIVQAIVEALTPVIEEIQEVQEELMKLKKDYKKFKSEASHEPLKNDNVVSKMFSTDSRYEVLKAMRQAK